MTQTPNQIILSPVPVGPLSSVGKFYDIRSEFPHDPFHYWLLWANYPWMFPGGVNRLNLPNGDPVVGGP